MSPEDDISVYTVDTQASEKSSALKDLQMLMVKKEFRGDFSQGINKVTQLVEDGISLEKCKIGPDILS